MNIFKTIYAKLRQFTLRELVILVAVLLILGAIIFGDAKAKIQTMEYQEPAPQAFVLNINNGQHFLICHPFQPGTWICGFSDTDPSARPSSM